MTKAGSGLREPGVRPDGEPAVRARALLALEDGTLFAGRRFGARGEATGEVVFNTAL